MPCGDIRYWAKCEDGHMRPVREHCDKWICPSCSRKLVAKQAIRAAERLEFAVPDFGRMYHYVISFRKVENRAKAIQVAKRFGLAGGSVIEHRTAGRPGNHFHLSAFGTFKIKAVRDFYSRVGTLVKRIRPVKNAMKLHKYELGHAYCPRGKQIVAYWGCISNHRLGFKRDEKGRLPRGEPQPCLCPKCNKQTYKVFAPEDVPHSCYSEPLYSRPTIRVLEWKTKNRQDTIS